MSTATQTWAQVVIDEITKKMPFPVALSGVPRNAIHLQLGFWAGWLDRTQAIAEPGLLTGDERMTLAHSVRAHIVSLQGRIGLPANLAKRWGDWFIYKG